MAKKFLEIKEFLSKIGLVFIFYMISRWLFLFFNYDLIKIKNVSDILILSFYGLKFDLAAIIYLQSAFILIYFFPFRSKFRIKLYETLLKFFYFFGAILGLALNFIDLAYYRFNLMRINAQFFEVIQNESNIVDLLFHFFKEYIYLFLLFFLLIRVWFFLYKKISNQQIVNNSNLTNTLSSSLIFLFVVFLCIGGVRGDYKKSTRPITLIHAMENVESPQHADFVLNSPFTVIRTFGKTNFKASYKFTDEEVNKIIKPIKHYSDNPKYDDRPNIIIFILESMGREYWGSLNSDNIIPNFQGYTPFLDSLSKHSLVFPNFFANSRKSIHGMPAILAGIPSFETAYTSSPYSNQPIESVVSIANNLRYNTSFFHGANNGSMGFLGFSKTLGFDNYYGKDEYNDDSDFDGFWGIWDEEFLHFTKKNLDQEKQPFLSTIFTLTSHDPYIIPEKYKGVFEKGYLPMHEAVGYTDYALKKFFNEAKNESWFDNTIFIFTADHGNQTYYPYYEKIINRFASPLMIYSPKGDIKGVSKTLGQHMDIFPTIVDLMNYNKPFRSWGKSLLSDAKTESFVVNYFGAGSYFIMNDKYIAVSNGQKIKGFYNSNDYDLDNNLIESPNKEMKDLGNKFKVFLQDYMNRIVKGKMIYKNE